MTRNRSATRDSREKNEISSSPNAEAIADTEARQRRTLPALALSLLLASSAGCAANHPFPHGEALDVPSLVSELETKPEDEEALFDLTYLPFLHLDLQVFTENDEIERYPEGHAYFSVRTWLPLFLFVDADVEFFDSQNVAYEKNAFMSILWGLWSRKETAVQTDHGERIARSGRFLWILDWGDYVEYVRP